MLSPTLNIKLTIAGYRNEGNDRCLDLRAVLQQTKCHSCIRKLGIRSCPSFLVVYGFQRPSDWLTLRVLWFPPPLASLIWPALSFPPVRSLSLLGSRPSFHHFGISVCLPPHSSWELLWCLAPSAVLHAAVTPCFFILILVTFIYYKYYTHLFIYILYIYFFFLSFFPFGPPSTSLGCP